MLRRLEVGGEIADRMMGGSVWSVGLKRGGVSLSDKMSVCLMGVKKLPALRRAGCLSLTC